MKKIFVYLFIFQIAYLPVQRANALLFIPGGVIAVEVLEAAALRYGASAVVAEVAASTSLGVRFAQTAQLAYSTFASWLSSNLYSVAGATAIATALGFTFTDDNHIGVLENEADSTGISGVQGYYWWASGVKAATPDEAADYVCTTTTDCHHYTAVDVEEDQVKYSIYETNPYFIENCTDDTNDGVCNYDQYSRIKSFYVNKTACDETTADFLTCYADYNGTIREATQDEIINDFIGAIPDSLSEAQQQLLLSDSTGQIYESLQEEFTSEMTALPVTLSGDELPLRGDELWVAADEILKGTAQSDDQTADHYVPGYMWDEAYYLANTVAAGDESITEWNANVTNDSTDTGTDSDSDSSTDGSGEVVASVEQLGQDLQTELDQINETDVETRTTPDKDVASSFWDVRYPDGIGGVFDDFLDQIKQTELFEWVSSFQIELGSGTAPIFEFCFDDIGGWNFGCYSLEYEAYVLNTIRALMILSAILVSRRIVFGG